jgi:hypothetical protein
MPSSLLQIVNSLFQTCYNKLGTSSVKTTCWQLVNRLVTTCLQTCYKLCVFTCVGELIVYMWKCTSCNKPAADLWQCCSNNLSTGCVRTACSQLVDKLSTACWQLATRLSNSTDLLQVVPTAIQQFVNKLWVTSLYKITEFLQLVDKLATCLLRTHLVNKLWDFYVCRSQHFLYRWSFIWFRFFINNIETKGWRYTFFVHILTTLLSSVDHTAICECRVTTSMI